MDAEFDCYGMTPEERAEFESTLTVGVRNNPFRRRESDGIFIWGDVHQAALGWAACAKLYRERLDSNVKSGVALLARIKELDAKNAALHTETNHLRLNLEGRSSSEFSLTQSLERAEARIKELEAQLADVKAQAAPIKRRRLPGPQRFVPKEGPETSHCPELEKKQGF